MIIDKYKTFSLYFPPILYLFPPILIRNSPVPAQLSFSITVSKEKSWVTLSIRMVSSDYNYDPVE